MGTPGFPSLAFILGGDELCVVLTPPAVSLQRWGMQEMQPVPSRVKAGAQRGQRRGADLLKGYTEQVDVPLP